MSINLPPDNAVLDEDGYPVPVRPVMVVRSDGTVAPTPSASSPSPTRDTASSAPFAIVPSDTVALATVPNGIYVGTGGDVVLRGVNSAADVTYKNLPDASFINVRASHVRATGTTAANLVGEA